MDQGKPHPLTQWVFVALSIRHAAIILSMIKRMENRIPENYQHEVLTLKHILKETECRLLDGTFSDEWLKRNQSES